MSGISSSTNLYAGAKSSAYKNDSSDRMIPSFAGMQKAQSSETYFLDPPKTDYEKVLMHALFPNYSSRTLHPHFLSSNVIETDLKKPLWNPSIRLKAPRVVNNFYYNNLDWGNIVVSNLDTSTCGYNPTNKITVQFNKINKFNNVELSAIKCSPSRDCFARGTVNSSLQVIDISTEKKTYAVVFSGGFDSIYSIDWKTPHELVVGMDGRIGFVDVRIRSRPSNIGTNSGAICALKWDANQKFLAVGSHFNSVSILDPSANSLFVGQYLHRAAVKALQWNPTNHSLLMSGGGRADQMLRVYDVAKQQIICEKSAGNQICSLAWLDHDFVVVGLENTMQYWQFHNNTLNKVSENSSQEGRILNVAKDPNSQRFASLSNQETLFFWEPKRVEKRSEPESKVGLKYYSIR